jgi:hypothetical protein
MLPVNYKTSRIVEQQVFEENQVKENLATSLGSRLGNCGNTLELKVLTQLHHVQ